MSTDHPSATTEIAHPDVRHERRDVSIGGLVMFAIWFVVILAVIHVVLFGYFTSLGRSQKAKQPDVPPVAQQRPQFPKDIGRIPAPRLQVEEVGDLRDLHRREDKVLAGYGWVDPAKGTVRLPIERTLEMLADPKQAAAKGLVARPVKEEKK